jgi:hypothetical protein
MTRWFNLSRLPTHFVQGLRFGTAAICGIVGIAMITLPLYLMATGMSKSSESILAKTLPIIGLMALIAGLIVALVIHSMGSAKEEKRQQQRAVALAHERTLAPRLRIMNGKGDRYALEIRGLGLSVNGTSQDEIWKPLISIKRHFESILSTDIEDYPKTSHDRLVDYSIASEIAAENVGLDAVPNWPVPSFAAQPPSHPTAQTAAGEGISSELQGASLVYTYAIWIDDVNGEDASPLIDKLFVFFDAHPEVPQAIVMCQDGDMVREFMAGQTTRMIEGPHKPDKPLSIVTLLVTRTDRIDRFMRPYTIHEEIIARTPQQTEYDYIKLYNFYWKEDERYGERHYGKYSSTTMNIDHWVSRLPDFLRTIDDKGVPGFQRTNFLPLRWTNWQVDLFDNAPIMGYLHRPITVRLRDEHEQPLTDEARTAALRTGWTRAVGTLPIDDVPSRVFRDTRNDQGVTKMLATILKEQPSPLDLDDLDQGIDIGERIGDTGIASPFVQIALATMASYKLGGPSATVHRRENGDVTFTMVSPPDAETKAAWEGEEKRNPFYAHVR